MKHSLIIILIAFIFVNISCDKSKQSKNETQETSIKEVTLKDIYYIGDICPAGGTVFYDKGEDTDGWRYLSVAPVEAQFEEGWGGRVEIDGTSAEIGTGMLNTKLVNEFYIAMGYTDTAVSLCLALEVNGYSDWFLPSVNELMQIHEILGDYKDFGGFAALSLYWSSTQGDVYGAWAVDLFTGELSSQDKPFPQMIRAIRAFGASPKGEEKPIITALQLASDKTYKLGGSGERTLLGTLNINGQIRKFEYDDNDRIVRAFIYYDEESYETFMLTYNGNNLTGIKKVPNAGDGIVEYRIEKNKITIETWGNSSTLTLNNDHQVIKNVMYDHGDKWENSYQFQNGNMTEQTEFHSCSDDDYSTKTVKKIVYHYDDKKSPFNCNTPKWIFHQWFFESIIVGKNNPISEIETENSIVDEEMRSQSQSVYEYNSDGFPTKQTRTGNGETQMITFTYK